MTERTAGARSLSRHYIGPEAMGEGDGEWGRGARGEGARGKNLGGPDGASPRPFLSDLRNSFSAGQHDGSDRLRSTPLHLHHKPQRRLVGERAGDLPVPFGGEPVVAG